jgi:predicted GIY-YIG superfamily endonuclease
VLLRDRLRARLDEMGDTPDYPRIAAEVLGIRNAPFELARRLVSQALVLEDRHEQWRRVGERVCAEAPTTAGVYVLRDAAGTVLYVGKAINLRRRLRTHFAARRWRGLKAPLARVDAAEWHEVGSELEALLTEATLIRDLRPVVNVQIGPPDPGGRIVPAGLVKDVIVILPSVEADSAELVGARADGGWMIQRTRRNGADLAVHARRLLRFFNSPLRRGEDAAPLAPIVFSWLAGRGATSSRLDPHDAATLKALQSSLATLLRDERLFVERIVVR